MPYCTIEDCNKLVRAKGLCESHYRKQWQQAHPDYQKSRKRNKTPCLIEGCIAMAHSRGLCMTHYGQARTHGDLDKFARIKRDITGGIEIEAEYYVWKGMIDRCRNKNRPDYPRYGGRGIRVAPEWVGKGGYHRFKGYIGKRPSQKHSVDRIDTNGNYEPGNVKWSTPHEQAANKRNSTDHVGVSFNKEMGYWFATLTINNVKVLHSTYHSKEEATAVRKFAEKIFIDNKFNLDLDSIDEKRCPGH